jgi:phosphotransferase family enzyme
VVLGFFAYVGPGLQREQTIETMETSSSDNRSVAPRLDDLVRIERALGWRPTTFRPATVERGTSDTAARWIVADDRRSAFVKIGATGLTAGWTRVEYRNYRSVHGSFLPDVLGFDDDGERPVLALEDLSRADWPPPWTDERVTGVLDALAAIHETPPPDHLTGQEPDQAVDWRTIAEDPGPFLALGLCSSVWLEAALPALLDASAAAPLVGDSLVHLDVRSDNLCFRDGQAIVIDWNHAAIANPDLDLAFWLPSLHAEGGPPPEAILSNAATLAAWVAGFFCARAGAAPIPEAPHVRPLQVEQSRTALPWAARALGLRLPAELAPDHRDVASRKGSDDR